ncbi:flagellar basal body-associated protein FliL [Pseudoroseomonas globiformis]|uniref:Flagellar protein FliL n=1 Tax=Teichococcus globiformis TaxID=2307229 RepID=A0ABV7G3M0_9PROT
MLALALFPVVLAATGAGVWFLVPGAADTARRLAGLAPNETTEAAVAAPAPAEMLKPVFVEYPEMTVTLPNGGRPRQLRLKLAVEIQAGLAPEAQPELMSPRVYDSLVLYLRTLRDGEMDGALAMERLRGDLHRRLELVLGPNTVRDVLITAFVVA